MNERSSNKQPSSATPAPPPRRRRWVFRVIAVLGTVAVVVGLLEATLWVVAPMPYPEWMEWVLDGHVRARAAPNQLVETALGEPIRINRHGFRGPDHEFAKAPGTLRIAVFGGSPAFCFHSTSEATTWPRAVEHKLAEALGMPVEVINLALPAYDAYRSKFNYLYYGRAFRPDVIIVYHTWNDMKQFRDLATTPFRPRVGDRGRAWWEHVGRATQIGRRIRQVLWDWQGRELEGRYKALEALDAVADQPVDAKALAWERQNFVDFGVLSRADGVLCVLVSQAGLASSESIQDTEIARVLSHSAGAVRMTLPRIVATWAQVSEIIQQTARDQDAVFVNGYDAVPHDLEHFVDHVHMWDAGCLKLAGALAETLLADARFRAVVERVMSEVPAP